MNRPPPSYEERVYPFPTDPLERVGNMLAAYNVSAKAITQLIVTRAPATRLELSKRFEEIVKDTALEITDSYNANRYCSYTLCPLGLVAEEKIPSTGRYPYVITYSLSEAGLKYGQPTAAAFLTFEQENGFSLFSILGPTFSNAPDNPKPTFTRAMILYELAKGSKSAIELSEIIHRSATVTTRSLTRLARSGAITYSTLYTRTSETQVAFSVAEIAVTQVAPVNRLSKLTVTIAQICKVLHKQHVPITHPTVFAVLREKQERRVKDKTLREMVSTVLAGLADQGFLRRLQFSRKDKSIATITTKGICVVEKLIKPLMEAMQDGTTLNRWQQTLLPRVQRQLYFYAEQTAALYYLLSKSRDKPDRLDKLALLQSVLQTSSGLTANQLSRKLRVDPVTVNAYLRLLEITHPITKTIRKSVAYYST